MQRLPLRTLLGIAKFLAFGLAGSVVVLLTGFVLFVNSQPDLKIWHTVELDAEFNRDLGLKTYGEYLALEERLFAQLDAEVRERLEEVDRHQLNRFQRGSLSDPGRWERDWNRSFELPVESPAAGFLLLHGMSDSPYSMRAIGQRLHAAGAWVVAPRLPGHGTAPSGLVDVLWQDMAAAVRLAALHLRSRIGDRPLYVVGFSNGGALAVHYALDGLEDESLPAADGLVLFSPAIGVSGMAKFAVWQERIGGLLGLDKLQWISVLPEYDPFKYQSFALNAGNQTYRLTLEIRDQLSWANHSGQVERLPPVLAFQSAVDATVSVTALTSGLMQQLPVNGSELVLFDINRQTEVERLLHRDPRTELATLLDRDDLTFAVSVITARQDSAHSAVARRRAHDSRDTEEQELGIAWPTGLFSLAHVAVPFSPADPLYGSGEGEASPGIQIGTAAYRGETGVLRISANDMLRLRWNPFYAYVEQRILAFADLGG